MISSHTLKFGISTYSYPWAIGVGGRYPKTPLDVFGLVEKARMLRAQSLQLADNLPVDQLPKSDWNTLMDKAGEYNIQLELGIRGLLIPMLLQYLELARACQSPFLRVVIDKDDFQPNHRQIVTILQEVLPAFKEAGIVLAIENHDRFRAGELIRILEESDPEWVGICLDTANSLGADEGLRQVAALLAPYTVNLHYKDYRIERLSHQMGFRVCGVPAGEGQIPTSWLLDLLIQESKCQSLTLEVWSEPLENLEDTVKREAEWVKKGAGFLNTVLAEHPEQASLTPTPHRKKTS